MTFKIEVFRLKETLDVLERLPRHVQYKPLRIALNAAGGVIKRSARAYVRHETGLLDKSLIVKVKIPQSNYRAKGHGGIAYALIGPNRKSQGIVQGGKKTTLKRLEKKGFRGLRVIRRRPSRYAHLLEKGHGGKHPAPPHSFLGMAVTVSGGHAQAVAIRKLHEGVLEAAAKLYRP